MSKELLGIARGYYATGIHQEEISQSGIRAQEQKGNMKELLDKEAARVVWSRILQEWEKLDNKLDDNDPQVWRKSCGMLICYITELRDDKGPVDFEFAIHSGDAEVILEQKLAAIDFEDAADQGDALIEEFLTIGADLVKTDEIRVTQAFLDGTTIKAVGIDGKLYTRRIDGKWESLSMKLVPTFQ